MVVIIDYILGNLDNVKRAVAYLGYTVEISDDPQKISEASHFLLPGVGAFGEGMANLRRKKLLFPIRNAISKGAYLLGLCLGMQL
jgi:imidazole glycerol-phosphate synthase subunit HisH